MRRHLGKDLVIVAALVAAGFLFAWVRFRPFLGDEGFYSDGARVVDVSRADGLRYAVWRRPEPLAGEVNGPGREGRASRTPDGAWLVFAGGERGVSADLYVARWDGVAWTDVRSLVELNTPFDEVAPRVTGNDLWFASNRPGGAGGLDLYRASFEDGRAGAPTRLSDDLNTARDETDPAPAPGGGLAFASDREEQGGDHDLFLAQPVRGAADGDGWLVERLDALSSPFEEREPAFGADGLTLVFASDRDGGLGGFDLWRAGRGFEGWTEPQLVRGLASTADERAPDPDRDGFTLRFARGSGDEVDLFQARSQELFRQPGKPIGWREVAVLIALLLLALLAWAAKHWRALDVLYRCYLVSLLLHLLLMLLMQRIHPEGEVAPTDDGGGRIRVRLVDPPVNLAARTERAGELELARAEAPSSALPESGELVSEPEASAPVAPEADFAEPARRDEPTARVALPDAQAQSTAEDARGDTAAQDVRELAEVFAAPERSESRFEIGAPSQVAAERSREEGSRPTASLRTEQRSTGEAPLARPGAPSIPSGERSTRTAAVQALAFEPRSAPRDGERSEIALHAPEPMGPRAGAPSRESAETGVELAADARRFERGTPTPSAPRAALGGAPPPGSAGARASVSPTVRPPTIERFERGADPGAVLALPGSEQAPGSAEPRRGSADLEVAVAAPDPERVPAPVPDSREAADDGYLQTARRFTRPALGGSDRDGLVALNRQAASAAARTAPAAAPQPLELVADSAPSSRVGLPEPERAPASARDDAEPFRTRRGPEKLRALEELGGSAATEAAVARGLAYLARVQKEDGYWGSAGDVHEKYGHVAVGKTALCVLAFLGAGHVPGSDTEHDEVVERAIAFLLAVQGERSGHFGDTSAYSHGISTYALAEAYAMGRDERLREPLERAVAHLLEHQDRTRERGRDGGWGYYRPSGRHVDPYPRTSITAWQVMALESARLGGLDVPDEALDRARVFLEDSWDSELGAYRYSHDPGRLRSGWPTLPGSTPAALFALSVLGADLREPRFAEARDFLLERMPDDFRRASTDAFVERARGNLYFVYYASLALLRAGEEPWRRWNVALQGFLLPSQSEDGSWAPISTYARDYAGDDPGDLSYTTAMAVLSLEVYYRYFTPLLESR